jgi:thiamine monophosphate synthase
MSSVALRMSSIRPVGLDRLLLEVVLHELLVVLGDGLDQLGARLMRGVGHVLGDVGDLPVLAEVVLVDDRLHVHEVDDAREVALRADRQLHRHRVRAEAVDHRLDRALEVGADPVHLVDERDARHAVLVGLAPDGLGLGSTPATESKTATAPSSTRRERSTSTVKSTWPGVSMMLMRWSRQKAVVAADVIVMPRSCSCSIQSITAAPSWTSPILWVRPV